MSQDKTPSPKLPQSEGADYFIVLDPEEDLVHFTYSADLGRSFGHEHIKDNQEAGRPAAKRWVVRPVAHLERTGQPVTNDAWLPTPDAINALPLPVRTYIRDLHTNCDPAGMVADNTILRDCNRGLQAMYRRLVDQAAGCFDAAYAEGLAEALAETNDERLKDLVERRLLHAYYAAQHASPPEAATAEATGKAPASVPSEAAGKCLSFFASVIKSGESWSPICEQMLADARAALAAQPRS